MSYLYFFKLNVKNKLHKKNFLKRIIYGNIQCKFKNSIELQKEYIISQIKWIIYFFLI